MNNHKKEENLPVSEDGGQSNGFDEKDTTTDKHSPTKEILRGFNGDWDGCDPRTASLLAPVAHRDDDDNFLKRLLVSVNRAAMPFHHLISAALLTPPSDLLPVRRAVYQSQTARPQRAQLFWQSLAERGISATEAVLLKDSIFCSFIELNDQRLVKTDWENLHHDELEGCAEVYLAEMFLCKRSIYEAGDELRTALEFTGDQLARYLPEAVFKPLVGETVDNLFFGSLSSAYTLTISAAAEGRTDVSKTKNQIRRKNGKDSKNIEAHTNGKITALADYFTSHITEGAQRVETWTSRKSSTESGGGKFYRLRLADYWLEWQRAARAGSFDFEYLQTIDNARAIRFYEVTKLWRVPPDHQPGGRISNKMEIEYNDFCFLMPLPRMTDTERGIKWQITELVKPLKSSGYLKSFTVKADWRGTCNQNAKLIFRFA